MNFMFIVLVIVICLITATFAEDILRDVLRSPKKTLKLYKDFKSSQHLFFGASEDSKRFRLFRKNAVFVADANENNDNAVFVLNFFSTMTPEEKRQHRGLNITGHQANEVMFASPGFEAPAKKLWTNEGAVTHVLDQGWCSSCWAFAAVGGLETRYQQLSGKLRKFSEQECVDCVYERSIEYGSCRGGWHDNCYTYSGYHGGRLAAEGDYLYEGRRGTCKGSSTPNAAIAAKITGYVRVGATESANIEALAAGSIAAAFKATDLFLQYSSGILKDTTCPDLAEPDHAVAVVGYTENFVLAKNSGGSGWGEQGFVKFARNHDNCGLFRFSSYPILSLTGTSDNGPSDPATNYRPSESGCKDRTPHYCTHMFSVHAHEFCLDDDVAEVYCRKTCNKCR